MACCGKTVHSTTMSPNITIKEIDFWLFSGFDGLINLLQKRALNNTLPLSATFLSELSRYIKELDENTKQIETFPENVLNSAEIDEALLNCLAVVLHTMQYRIRYCHKTQQKEVTNILRTSVEKLKGVLVGYQAADYRAQNPYEQGVKDASGGWPNRGSKLFPHAQQVGEYERGYSTIKRI